jgi:hypothetical protein
MSRKRIKEISGEESVSLHVYCFFLSFTGFFVSKSKSLANIIAQTMNVRIWNTTTAFTTEETNEEDQYETYRVATIPEVTPRSQNSMVWWATSLPGNFSGGGQLWVL